MNEPISEEELAREANPGNDQAGTFSPGEVGAQPNPPGALLIDRVLLLVRLERLKQDERDGILRDYRDGTLGTRFHGPAATTDKQNVLEAQRQLADAAKAGRQSWRHFLELAVAEVFATRGSENGDGDPAKLRQRLIEVAATACAWAEGIAIRADDRRIALEQRAMVIEKGRLVRLGAETWWRRLLRFLRLTK